MIHGITKQSCRWYNQLKKKKTPNSRTSTEYLCNIPSE